MDMQYARFTVHDKRPSLRANRRLGMRYSLCMSTGDWVPRFWREVDSFKERTGMSDNALSVAAGKSRNYLQQLRENGHRPKLDAVEGFCTAMGLPLIYMLTGIPMDEDGEELIRLAGSGSNADRHHIVQLLRGRRGSSEPK